MIHLVLAILSSTAIVVVFKLTKGRFDRLSLVTVNYAAAVGAAALLLRLDPPDRGLAADPGLLLLGTALGLLFVAGFVLLGRAIDEAGISLAAAVMRLSVAIPFVASWLVWGEVPSPAQGAGLVLAAVAFVLISRPAPVSALPVEPVSALPVEEMGMAPRPRRPLVAFLLLSLLFVTGGMVDTSLKLFEETFAETNSRAHFLLVVFAVALVTGALLVLARGIRTRRWPSRGVLGWGAVLGLVNYGSAEFMLRALRDIPGTVAFPVNNVAVVTLATLLGMGVWRERTGTGHRAGLLLALVALVLFGF
ncbi:MAG: hypothetical protein EA352_00110 [Gemmatimonadales bacterium]|nr:MAG: hypothetical protein EA352_00110 [Gemmatimonadales bacterium]